MTRTMKDQRERIQFVRALTDLHTAAAAALVKRDTNEVEAVEFVADSIMRRFGNRKDPEPFHRVVKRLEAQRDRLWEALEELHEITYTHVDVIGWGGVFAKARSALNATANGGEGEA